MENKKFILLLNFAFCFAMPLLHGAAESMVKPEPKIESTELGEFGHLPSEAIYKIINNLPYQTLARLGKTSSLFYSLELEKAPLHLWTTKKAQSRPIVVQREGERKIIHSLSFSVDGNILAVGCDDRKIRLLDVKTGGERMVFSDPGQYREVSFSPVDTNLLGLVSSIGGYKLVNLETNMPEHIIDEVPYNLHRKIIFSNDGKLVAVADMHANIWLADVNADRRLENVRKIKSLTGPKDISPDIMSVSIVDNRRLLVAAIPWNNPGVKIYQIDIASGAISEIVQLKTANLECAPYAIAGREASISPDGMTFAGEFEWDYPRIYHLLLWNLRQDKKVVELVLPAELRALAFSPDSKIVAAKLQNAHVILVNAVTGEIIKELQPPQGVCDSCNRALTFSPRGDLLAVGYGDGLIMLWQVGD